MELTVRPNLSAAQVYKFLVVFCFFFFQMPCSFCAFIKKHIFLESQFYIGVRFEENAVLAVKGL